MDLKYVYVFFFLCVIFVVYMFWREKVLSGLVTNPTKHIGIKISLEDDPSNSSNCSNSSNSSNPKPRRFTANLNQVVTRITLVVLVGLVALVALRIITVTIL